MKKITKISALILIILSIFGITTSVKADYCVDGNNPWVIDTETSRQTVATIPGEYRPSGTENSDNTYAKNYILSATSYTEEERQEAYYCIIGDENGVANELYYKAIEFQQMKLAAEAGELIQLEKAELAKTLINGNGLTYGPIYVRYPYGEIEERRTWGGFYYGFFDEDGNNLSDKVKLCILENGEYKEITSELTAEGEMSGYYKVTTGDYQNAELYLSVSDRQISKVKIKVRSFQIVRKAVIIRVTGTTTVPGGVWYCDECKGKISYDWDYCSHTSKACSHGGEFVSSVTSTKYRYTTMNPPVAGQVYSCPIPGCGFRGKGAHEGPHEPYYETSYLFRYKVVIPYTGEGCGRVQTGVKDGRIYGTYLCGTAYAGGTYEAQAREIVDELDIEEELFDWAELEIELGTTIEITKEWSDYYNMYQLRPEELDFNVYRSIDNNNWELLTEDVDYSVIIENKDYTNWKILITGLLRMDENQNEYYFKVEEKEQTYFDAEYPNGNYPTFTDNPAYGYMTIKNAFKKINLSGYVWLDGQTGIKPAVPHNGIMEDSEQRMKDIVVELWFANPNGFIWEKVDEAVTDENGHYEFRDHEIGYYCAVFFYDGVRYINTISGGSSKAFETEDTRNSFNSRFQTITYKQSNDGTNLEYKYEDKKSSLITNEEGRTTIKQEFQMHAFSEVNLLLTDTDNINLGLVKRGLDIALSTDVYDANVTINGQATNYVFNREDNNIEIGSSQTNEQVTYNLNLYASDYNYRVRDYVNTQGFQEKDYITNENPGIQTGEDLRVQVIYELNLQNQSTQPTKINEVKYVYDEKYSFIGLKDSTYGLQDEGNVLTINLEGLELAEGETKTIYLVFEIKETNDAVNLGDFSNKAEITSYSNIEGLIDTDSQPGNFIFDNQVEDDSDTAGGLTVKAENVIRKITGKVFDNGNSQSPVNDVIVQLIELKTVNGKVYEYIWQETVSGTEQGLRLNADGTALEQYSYTKADGYYEFKGFIPGDYIVRFIYGDGTTYDMTESVVKYNGQDYKSMTDSYYNAEWYNTSSYTEGSSVARDNEARRLETMAYSVEIDASKGVLLKLLDNVTPDTLNETEKEVIKSTYKDIYGTDITEVTQDIINQLLKEQTLKNTWMCAETSKIKVAVDTENIENTTETTNVNGIIQNYVNEIQNINLGLEKRPETKIELKKYITGMKLMASNGQTLVNAYVDVNKYLDPTITDISSEVQGIKDNVTILNTVWQYEVVPTEINTIVDGANLEFEYTIVVRNLSSDDYLSEELANAYNTSSIGDYKTVLTTKAAEVKGSMRQGTYRTQIGNLLGTRYYTGGTGTGNVLTEITNIRDYINNELTFVTSGNVAIDEDASHTYRTLREDHSMQDTTINTVLKTTESTGKLSNTDNAVMYTVTLGRNPISTTGVLEFDTYIAEVMSYTNAAGRRANTSTPGNAEIIDREQRDGREHEIDEADTGRIQIGVATGADKVTNYIIIISAALGMVLVAVGTVVIKKRLIK